MGLLDFLQNATLAAGAAASIAGASATAEPANLAGSVADDNTTSYGGISRDASADAASAACNDATTSNNDTSTSQAK